MIITIKIKWWLKIIKTNKPRLISINPTYQTVITTDASPVAWGVTFQVVKNKPKKGNAKVIARRKRPSNSIGKRQILLPNRFKEYKVELYRSKS
jgi:hypothetical protein